MLPLSFERSPFPCIIPFFLNKVILETRIFLIFENLLNHEEKDPKQIYCRLLCKEFHLYIDPYDMFHIYNFLSRLISLADAILL